MTELRRRMDEDMIVRGMADRTRETYLWAVTGLTRFYRRPPDQIADDEVQAYVLHLIRDRQLSWSTCDIVVHGLRVLYHTTLKRERTTFCIPSARQPGTLPVRLSRDEVQRLIAQAATGRIGRCCGRPTRAACGSPRCSISAGTTSTRRGLRSGSSRARAARTATRSSRHLCSTRSVPTGGGPSVDVVVSRARAARTDPSGLQRAYTLATRRAGITKPGGIHPLRHVFAPHPLEAGVDLHTIQRLLGHKSITTTTRYWHLTHTSLTTPAARLELLPDLPLLPRA